MSDRFYTQDEVARMTPEEAQAALQSTSNPWDGRHDLLFERAAHNVVVPTLSEDDVPPPEFAGGGGPQTSIKPSLLASQKQLDFIRSLREQKEITDAQDRYLGQVLEGTRVLSKRDASKVIDFLLNKSGDRHYHPVGEPSRGLDLSTIPAGRYAVPDGETRLKVQIDKPSKGRWEGFVFVKDGAEYGQHRRYGMQRPGETYQGQIVEQLERIVADPIEAMKEYGRITGTCGNCNRKLEDEVSVARGIGPICWGRLMEGAA